ncbi:MAG TPA: hypothetical protein VHB70_16120 [Parafilimonas sp.]|nr:hypothetical protein [Parafilimonas sp.]
MKKQFLLVILFFLPALFVKAQSSYSIIPMQAGTIDLNSNNVVINLSEDVKQVLNDKYLDASYYVVFTPIDNTIIPAVSNKNNNSFTAMSLNQKVHGHVDYIVFVKRKVMQLNATKNLSKSNNHK